MQEDYKRYLRPVLYAQLAKDNVIMAQRPGGIFVRKLSVAGWYFKELDLRKQRYYCIYTLYNPVKVCNTRRSNTKREDA